MKKFLLVLISVLFILLFSGCGNSDESNQVVDSTNEESNDTETITSENDSEEEADIHEHEPLEPDENTVCDSCNMKVYEKDYQLGVFTAQGITQDGENVFFDDIGCILNYERKNGEELAVEWIRDYLTLEWAILDESTPVKTELTSPMKYGYISFQHLEEAKAFIEDDRNSEINPTLAEWSEVDAVANDRFQNKMKAQQKQKGKGNNEQ